MKTFLLDTNIISYAEKGGPLWRLYRPFVENNATYISFMTVAEIVEGVERAKRQGLPYQRYLTALDRYSVIPCSGTICRIFGRIRSDRYRRPIAVDDAFIAATALAYDIPLLTHNPVDFDGIEQLKIETKQGA